MDSQTTDTFFGGKLLVKQEAAGYRFSIDAILLAHHASVHPGERLLDLGTGCGIIPLILAYRHPDITAIGIEIQNELADLAVSNVNANQMQNRITVLRLDIRNLKPAMIGGPADVVVCNRIGLFIFLVARATGIILSLSSGVRMATRKPNPGVSRAARISDEGLQRLAAQLEHGVKISDMVLAQWIRRYGDAARELLKRHGAYHKDLG